MGNCKYCNQKAGFLKNKHKECEKKYTNGVNSIPHIICNAFIEKNISNNISEIINEIAKDNFIADMEKKSLIIKGWHKSVDTAFEDKILSCEEESLLLKIMNHFALTQSDLDSDGHYSKLAKGSILREVMNGEIPASSLNIKGHLPFNTQKNEQLIWVQNHVKYLETKTKTQYIGRQQGLNIRLARGIYYKTSIFKGNKVQSNYVDFADEGLLAITNKHIYFGGAIKHFRVNIDKIVSFLPYADGFGVQKDSSTAKPQFFITGDSWFFINLLSNL